MTINEKIKILDNLEKSKGSRLYKKLEVPRSTIDSIINKNHQPGYGLLASIIKAYPTLDPKWLFLDNEEMWLLVPDTLQKNASTNPWDSHSYIINTLKELIEKSQALEIIQGEIKSLKSLHSKHTEKMQWLTQELEKSKKQ